MGVTQELTVEEVAQGGLWLGSRGEERAWLPAAEAPEGASEGQRLEVFVHADKEGRPIATTTRPLAQFGEFACLEVADVSRHGIHLNWGLDRDLFLPFALQHDRLRVGDDVVVVVQIDDQGRPFATARLTEVFDFDPSALQVDQKVFLLVYGFNDVGAQVVVNGRYAGIVYKNQTFVPVKLGDTLQGWVDHLRVDGRVDVRLHQLQNRPPRDAREFLLGRLEQSGGFLPLHDRSSPEEVRRVLHMSKKAFKRAVGNLYRDRRITLEDGGIRLKGR